ncbi:MAG: hypothetical protein AAF502_01155 [Bacteroidota bacterium]
MKTSLKLIISFCLCLMLGQNALSQTNQILLTGADRVHGFSWDGTIAHYVVKSGNAYNVIKQPFDGEKFGNILNTKTIPMSSYPAGSVIRGYNVHLNSASQEVISYVVYNTSETLVMICEPGGSFNVSDSLKMSGADIIRGWWWNGTSNASYIGFFENSYTNNISQFFDGERFGTAKHTRLFNSDLLRAWNELDGDMNNYCIVSGGKTYISGALLRPKWLPAKDDGCHSHGKRKWSAMLERNGNKTWEDAARTTPIVIDGRHGRHVGVPDEISLQGLGGTWGEWYVNDDNCNAEWDTPQRDFCIGNGIVQYSARFNVAGEINEDLAMITPARILGQNETPYLVEWDQVGNLWGLFKIEYDVCLIDWDYIDDVLKSVVPENVYTCDAQTLNNYMATDGCSTSLNDPASKGLKSLFFIPCVLHDLCYCQPWEENGFTANEGKDICDLLFNDKMRELCDNPTCFSGALVWTSAVILAAQNAFDMNQNRRERSQLPCDE